MIQKVLQFTNEVLQQFLQNKFDLDEDIVISNNLIDADGSIPQKNKNKVIISLINLEHETSKPFNVSNKKLHDGNFAMNAPSNRYNLDILVTANFDDYNETLKFLNAVILFFQINQAIDSSTNSNIPKEITKLVFDLEKNSYHQMHSLWTAMGAKYRPSVIYKMRMITLQDDRIKEEIPAIKGLGTN